MASLCHQWEAGKQRWREGRAGPGRQDDRDRLDRLAAISACLDERSPPSNVTIVPTARYPFEKFPTHS